VPGGLCVSPWLPVSVPFAHGYRRAILNPLIMHNKTPETPSSGRPQMPPRHPPLPPESPGVPLMPRIPRHCIAPQPYNPQIPCNKPFFSNHPMQLYCSDACAVRTQRARRRARLRISPHDRQILEAAAALDSSITPALDSTSPLPSQKSSGQVALDILSKYKD
jgi:hypothetical protein